MAHRLRKIQQQEIMTMSTVRHRFPDSYKKNNRADRVTVWLLVVVIVAALMALTFGNAGGAPLL